MNEIPRQLRVHISFSSIDGDFAKMSYDRLNELGVDAWIYQEKLLPGSDWVQEILISIRRADIVIFCLSKKAVNKDGVLYKQIREAVKEFDFKADKAIYLLPIRIDDCEIPEKLRIVNFVDWEDGKGWNRLVHSIQIRSKQIEGVKEIDIQDMDISNIDLESNKGEINTGQDQKQFQGQDNMLKSNSNIKNRANLFGFIQASKLISDFSNNISNILREYGDMQPGSVERIATSQIKLLTNYYSLVLMQAQRSFSWALIWATVGILCFIVSGVFLFINNLDNIAIIGTIGGALVEIISGINFYLFNKASTQLAEFHIRLDATQKLLLSNAVAEKIEGDLKQITRSYIALKFAGIDIEPDEIEKSLDLETEICITHIEINPSGNDIAKEFVRIENVGKVVADLTKWSLSDEAGHIYKFPLFFLKPGASVSVWTKIGKNSPTDLYWRRKQAVWNNDKDIAYLRNDLGALVDKFQYSVDSNQNLGRS